MTNKTLLHRQ